MIPGAAHRAIIGLINIFNSWGRQCTCGSDFRRVFLSLLIVFNYISVFSQDYTLRNFRTDDGLAQPYVYSIIQDDKGYLWIGTGNGLSRFNGSVFETFTTADSLADNFITSGVSAGKYTWFGHMNGSLSCFDGKKFRPYRSRPDGASPVTHFAKSPDGGIWLSTYSDGFMRIDKDNRLIRQSPIKGRASILTFEFINDKELHQIHFKRKPMLM